MIEKVVTSYIAKDGKKFFSKDECLAYESTLKTLKIFKFEYNYNDIENKWDNYVYFCVDYYDCHSILVDMFVNKSRCFSFNFQYKFENGKIRKNYGLTEIQFLDYSIYKPILLCSSKDQYKYTKKDLFKAMYLYDEDFLRIF